MRWFINSTKESAGFNDHNNVQAQIGALHTRIDSQQKQLTNQMDEIKKRIDIRTNNSLNKFNRINDSLHDKGIQINNILKHQGNQDERIENLENKLQYALHKIEELADRIKVIEYQNMQKQSIPDEKPKRERIANSYADEKYSNAFKIAMVYWSTGMKQEKIAEKLNALNIKTPTGKSFHQGNVSDLLANREQKARFMEGKEKKAKL